MARPSVPRVRLAQPAFTGWQWFLIAAATGLATALRLCDLGSWSFWVDEAHTYRDATMPLDGEYGFLSQARVWYPLTFLGLRGLLDLGWIGTDEASLRLPFAVAGIATVPLMALCGRALVGAPAAVLSAWLCAMNPWHLFWSQNARGYVFAVLFSVIAINRVQRWSESRRPRDMVAALLAIGFGALCHLTAGMLAVALLAFLLVRAVRTWNVRTLVGFAVGAVALLTVLPWAIAEWAPFQGHLEAKSAASLVHFVQTTGYYFRPLSLLAAFAALFLMSERLGRARAMLLGCFAILPFVLLSVLGGSIVKTTARYAICALPVILWLSAHACTALAAALSSRGGTSRLALRLCGMVLPMAIAADFVGQVWAYYHTEHGGRAQWREACAMATRRAGEAGLRVLTINEPTAQYYLERQHWADVGRSTDGRVKVRLLSWWGVAGKDQNEVVLHEPGGRAHLAWHLAAAQRDKALLVVFVTLPELAEVNPDGSVWQALQRDFELVLHLPCWVGPKDESIYVFVPNGT